MTLDSRLLRGAGVLALALVAGGCGKKVESAGDAAAVPNVATRAGSGDDDMVRDVARYQLTMADVRKWVTASENMTRRKDTDDPCGEGHFDQIIACYERGPGLKRAIEGAGLSVRKYVLIQSALMQATIAQQVIEQGANADSLARSAGIHPGNLTFVKQHEAELAKLR